MIFGGIPIPMPAGCTPAVDRRRMAPRRSLSSPSQHLCIGHLLVLALMLGSTVAAQDPLSIPADVVNNRVRASGRS